MPRLVSSIPAKYAAVQLRARLRKEFPGVKFSVRSDSSSISVRWTDGPDRAAVTAVTAPFKGSDWDGFDETYRSTGNTLTVTIDGEEVTGPPLVDHLSVTREFSPEVIAEAEVLWSAAFDGADPKTAGGMRGAFRVEGKRIDDSWAPNQVHQIAQDVVTPRLWAAARAEAPKVPAKPRRKAPAKPAEDAGITVAYTEESGVTVTGTTFGDGAAPILRALGLDWDERGGYWYERGAQGDTSGAGPIVARAAFDALTAAGITATTDLPELPAGTTLPTTAAPAPAAEDGDDVPEDFTGIVLRHTRAGGTLAEGTARGDGTAPILKAHRFRWSRNLEAWYLPHSRDKRADRYTLDRLTAALRDAGHDVHQAIREDIARSFADAEAERETRAADRADRFADRADRAAANSKAAHRAGRSIAEHIPFGQPILVGHHSERRHRRDLDRIDAHHRKGVEEGKRADYWAGRADAAAHYEQHRKDPARTLRRIKGLEADLRGYERLLAGESAFGSSRDINDPDVVAELTRRHGEISDELRHWRELVARAEAEGVKVWSKADFTRGDYVRARGHWYEVLRVNAQSVTVPGGPDIQPVIDSQTRAYTWDDRLPYDGVTGRRSAEEMAKHRAAGA